MDAIKFLVGSCTYFSMATISVALQVRLVEQWLQQIARSSITASSVTLQIASEPSLVALVGGSVCVCVLKVLYLSTSEIEAILFLRNDITRSIRLWTHSKYQIWDLHGCDIYEIIIFCVQRSTLCKKPGDYILQTWCLCLSTILMCVGSCHSLGG
jgi:hypothetical protein